MKILIAKASQFKIRDPEPSIRCHSWHKKLKSLSYFLKYMLNHFSTIINYLVGNADYNKENTCMIWMFGRLYRGQSLPKKDLCQKNVLTRKVEPNKEGNFFPINLDEKGIAHCKPWTEFEEMNDN